MAATTQTIVDGWQTQVETDGTLTTAQKARCQTLFYAIAAILFGGNAASAVNNTGKSGKNDGH